MRRGVRFEHDDAEPAVEPGIVLREQFRARVAAGRYDELLDESMRALLREGTEIRGMAVELGAIRFALAKLLAEEQDAGKLASGVARLTSASVHAMKMEQTISDEVDESLADALNQILIDLEKESHVARAAREERGDDRAERHDSALAGP